MALPGSGLKELSLLRNDMSEAALGKLLATNDVGGEERCFVKASST